MTLAAVIAGPVGVALGFALSTWGDSRKAKRAAAERRRSDDVARALAVLSAATLAEQEGRGLGHALHLRAARPMSPPSQDQIRASIASLNGAKATLDRLIIEADVLGPHGLPEVTRELHAHTIDMITVVQGLQERFTSEGSKKIQEETIPQFVAAIETATARVRKILAA